MHTLVAVSLFPDIPWQESTEADTHGEKHVAPQQSVLQVWVLNLSVLQPMVL